MLYYNGDIVKKISYNDHELDKLFYNGLLVWQKAFYSKVKVTLLSEIRQGTRGKKNPAYTQWETDCANLYKEWTTKTSERDSIERSVKESLGWYDAKTRLSKANREKDKAVNRYRDLERKYMSLDDAYTKLALKKYNEYYEEAKITYNVDALKEDSDNKWNIYKDAYQAQKDWEEANPKPEKTIENPEYTTWKADHKVYVDALANAQADYTVAENAYNTAKKNYDDAVTAGESAEEIARLKQIMEDAAADKASAAGAVAEAKHNKEWWEQLNPKPAETIHNPEYDAWKEQYDEYFLITEDAWQEQQTAYLAYESARNNANTTAWNKTDADAEVIKAKQDSEKAKADFDTYKTEVYEPAITEQQNAQSSFDSINTAVENNTELNNAIAAADEAWDNYSNLKNSPPPITITEACTYTFYKLKASLVNDPGLRTSAIRIFIDVKINNNQPNTSGYTFIDVNRGPITDTLSLTLSLDSPTAETEYTDWGSMNCTYGDAILDIRASNRSNRTFIINTNEDFVTDEFSFYVINH